MTQSPGSLCGLAANRLRTIAAVGQSNARFRLRTEIPARQRPTSANGDGGVILTLEAVPGIANRAPHPTNFLPETTLPRISLGLPGWRER
jgi:hypothetical protein